MNSPTREFDPEALAGETDLPITRAALALLIAANWYRDLADQILRIDPSLLRKAGFTSEDVPMLRLHHAELQRWHKFLDGMDSQASNRRMRSLDPRSNSSSSTD
ncbi:hypothetical protein [Aeoliella sp.]|uniref:hypothetical protein n=1 Tax=Aeoliella sp. TaxID=2795800 RepID=UPI003CCC422F